MSSHGDLANGDVSAGDGCSGVESATCTASGEAVAWKDRKKVALVTGITGQDGSYLAEFLLGKGYEVHGIIRRASTFNTHRIEHLYENPNSHAEGAKFKLHYGDMTDSSCLIKIIAEVRPTEIYNLAAQSHVKVSFDLSEYTANVDAVGTLRLLDAVRTCNLTKQVRFYQASTSEMYGLVQEVPQSETTPFYPRSPYGVAKLYAHWIVINYREAYGLFSCNGILFNHESPRRGVAKLYSYWIIRNYREAYGMFAGNGILFNHESPRRGETFVTRKITRAVAKIHLGQQQFVELGNLDSHRDWGHAKDYVEAMWMMLQQDTPDDFVISTGETHTVRKFVMAAFKHINVDIVWEGKGENEVGKDMASDIVRVKINPKFYRPTEVEFLLGDSTKARRELGWAPKYDFDALVKEMMEADMALMKSNPTA